jgi:hypothetical protein
MSESPELGNHDYLPARSMAPRFLIRTRLDGHDVADHGVVGKMDAEPARSNAAPY